MKKFPLLFAFVGMFALAIGCGDMETAQTSQDAGLDDSAHDHTAPHGGRLIDLGRSHKYHAELMDDHGANSLVIHILDAKLQSLAIDARSVTLVLTNGDDTQTFELPANQDGKSSEFESDDQQLLAMLDKDGTEGKLRVSINNQPVSGTFEHHHHDDHE